MGCEFDGVDGRDFVAGRDVWADDGGPSGDTEYFDATPTDVASAEPKAEEVADVSPEPTA